MTVYSRSTHVDAPLDEVWDFHVDPATLPAVTPDWMGLRVEEVRHPDDRGSDRLVEGSEVHLSARPFGVGPRVGWTSRIAVAERGDEVAWFRDEMVDGPFARWVHTHRFEATDGGTVIRDRVDWALPGGAAGEVAALPGRVGLAPVFRHRHARTRELLEG